MPSPLAVASPGKRMHADSVIPDVTITLGDYKFLASPTVLGDSDIDLFLEWIGFLSTRLSLIVQPGRFN